MSGTAGTMAGVVKVRVMAEPDAAAAIAGKVVEALEADGYQVIEWTKPHPCMEPDQDKSKVFITALAGTN